MWVDKGREFYNKDVRKLVEIYSTENEEKKSCVIERFNRTIKDKIFKYYKYYLLQIQLGNILTSSTSSLTIQ